MNHTFFLTLALRIAAGCASVDDDPIDTVEETDQADETDPQIAPTCADWCAVLFATCPESAPMDDEVTCNTYCDGTGMATGFLGESTGNTAACRIFHLSLAADATDPAARAAACDAGSPSGGGVCGTLVGNFCENAAFVCQEEWALSWNPDCETVASALPVGEPGPVPADTLSCRWYILGQVAASGDPSGCVNAAQDSALCVDP